MSASEVTRSARAWLVAAAAALTAVAGSTVASADDAPTASTAAAAVVAPAAPPAAQAPALTAEDAGAWLDGFMPNALKQADIAGAVVSIVKDGQVLVERGYGYADIKKETPMDPARTLVRPGSISKLFTWTAVMQLVEQGKLDLDTDVNQYLDFTIPARNGKPITLRNVMTHTAGFEETLKNLIAEEGDPLDDFDVLLKDRIPARIFPPGTTPAYSNYATSLAGYIVQRVSGMSFYDYVARNVFAPLGMQSTTFRQPLPEDWKPRMAEGYENASSKPQKFELVGPSPAGSVSTTADDMARFMIAHLQDGRYGEARILKPETAQLMHGTALTIIPRLNRMLLGFYEADYQGRRVISHGGDTMWFHSDLYLFLDHGTGLFVSFNSLGKDGAAHAVRSTLKDKFADRYFPMPKDTSAKVDEKTAKEHAAQIAGHYLNSRRVETTFMSLLNVATEVKVVANEDGTISVDMWKSPTGVPFRWKEIEPYVWRQEHENDLLAAEVKDGRVTRFSFDGLSPFMIFERPAPLKAGTWLLPATIVALSTLLLTALAWPISALARRYFRAPSRLPDTDARALRRTRVVAWATVLVWAGWIGLIVAMLGNIELLAPKTDKWVWLLQIVGAIVFVGGTLLGLHSVWTTLRGTRRPLAKAWAALVGLSLVVSLWLAVAFHVLSFGVKY